jgi:hypothetical protein
MIPQRFRRDYLGEYVISKTTFRDGIKTQDREWVPNPVINQQISNRAVVIFSNQDHKKFDLRCLPRHRGGLLGKNKLQTYGTGDIWQHIKLDFYAGTDYQHIANIAKSDYHEHTVIMTNRQHVLDNSGKFYLIPYCPMISDPAAALYAACFDYHKEIFVLGASKELRYRDSKWINHVSQIMDTYFTFQFYFVGVESNLPVDWRQRRNFRSMDHRRFISYCDL